MDTGTQAQPATPNGNGRRRFVISAAAVAVVVSIIFGVLNYRQGDRDLDQSQAAAKKADAAALESTLDTIATQLADQHRTIRLNGVAKAAQVLNATPATQGRVIPLLAEMIRENATRPTTGSPPPTPPPDITQALDLVAHQHGTDSRNPEEMVNPDGYVQPDLTGAYLAGATLDKPYLAGAHLDQTDLTRATIKGGTFWWATMHGTQFSYATVEDTDFTAAVADKFRGNPAAVFDHAVVQNDTLTHASLDYANFDHAIMNLTFDEGDRPDPNSNDALVSLSHASFKGALIAYSHIEAADLTGADFTDASLVYTEFHNTLMSPATFKGAGLGRVTITGPVDLTQTRAHDHVKVTP